MVGLPTQAGRRQRDLERLPRRAFGAASSMAAISSSMSGSRLLASPLANPTATQGYPIVGTTNFLTYTCYLNRHRASRMSQYIQWYVGNKVVSDSKRGLLASAGLAPLPKKWITAIEEAFIFGNDGQGLKLSLAGDAGVCSEPGITGG